MYVLIKQIDRWLEGKQKYEEKNRWMVGWTGKKQKDGWMDRKKRDG